MNVSIENGIDWAKMVGYFVAAFIGVNIDVLVAWLGLMILDSILGAISYARIEGFSWKEFRKGVFAKFLVLIVPLSFALVVKASGREMYWVGFGVSTIVFLFSLGEGVSILFHYLSIRSGKRQKPKQDFILTTINFLISKMKAVFSAITNKTEL